jgi:hypothetical protein
VNLGPWRCRCTARARTERAATAPTCNGRQRPVAWSPLSAHPCVKSRSKRPGSFGRIYAWERQSPSMSPRLRGQQAACSQGMAITSFVVAATTWSYAGLACLASTECEKIQAPSPCGFPGVTVSPRRGAPGPVLDQPAVLLFGARALASSLNCGADELPRRSPNLEPPRNCALCCRMTHHILWQWVCYSRLRNRRKNRPIKPEVAIEMPKNLDKMGPWLHYREVCNAYLGA